MTTKCSVDKCTVERSDPICDTRESRIKKLPRVWQRYGARIRRRRKWRNTKVGGLWIREAKIVLSDCYRHSTRQPERHIDSTGRLAKCTVSRQNTDLVTHQRQLEDFFDRACSHLIY